MALFRKHSMASAIALAISLTACGGGGGGGGIASTPPAPPSPTPTPTPTPAAAAIGAAAMATAPNANLFPRATAVGPTMQAHPTTAFPLLQSVFTVNGSVAGADTVAMNGGATLSFDYPGDKVGDKINLAVPGLFSDVSLVAGGGYYCYSFCAQVGSRYTELEFADPTTSNLSWTTYGTWYSSSSQARNYGAFVTGYTTPAASVPTTGTATYTGSAQGHVFYPDAGWQNGVGHNYVSGNASLQANFGSGSITGSLTNMTNGSAPWNSVSLLGAISGGNFTGTTAATSAPGTLGSLRSSATGTFAGLFFGPVAQELGAVWTLHDGTSTVIGTIGARTGP